MPSLAHLPLVIVEPWGTDNAIWRLGSELVVRLPRIGWAAGQAELEQLWLPRLAPSLPVAIPEPVALGSRRTTTHTGGPCTDGFPVRVLRSTE